MRAASTIFSRQSLKHKWQRDARVFCRGRKARGVEVALHRLQQLRPGVVEVNDGKATKKFFGMWTRFGDAI